LGELFREGRVYSKEEIQSFDHDYPYLSKGTVNMYSVYDLERNEGYVGIGSSKETGEMACNTIKEWWVNEGEINYPNAVSECKNISPRNDTSISQRYKNRNALPIWSKILRTSKKRNGRIYGKIASSSLIKLTKTKHRRCWP
jgi:hypothetical protein